MQSGYALFGIKYHPLIPFLDSAIVERKKTGLIKHWTAVVNSFPPSQTSSRATSVAKSQVSTINNASAHSTVKSVLTDAVVISEERLKNQELATPDDIGDRGLEDEDETKGQERDVAIASPIKGRKRLTSSVCSTISIFQETAHLTRLRISSNSRSV
jgi:hypothetical protein